MLVQAIPRFVGAFPPVEEFTAYVARRPPPLVEVRPSVRALRHVAEQLADIAPMVQILDSPEPQTSEQLLEVFRLLDTHMPVEQAIAVPKITKHLIQPRLVDCDQRYPQKVEQLVDFFENLDIEVPAQVIEVPKISQDIIPQRSVDLVPQIVEQLVEVPTVLTPTRIAVQIAEQIVDTPVHRERDRRLQDSLPGHACWCANDTAMVLTVQKHRDSSVAVHW